MANLSETTQWEDGIYQLEETDYAKGGAPPGGTLNVPTQQLANRTAYLRELLEERPREFLQVQFLDVTQVLVPRVTIPAASFGAFPASDLVVGGFLVDQHLCSHASSEPFGAGLSSNQFTGPGDVTAADKALSLPARYPWTGLAGLDVDIAEAAIDARSLSHQLMDPQTWAEITLIGKWLGVAPRGNIFSGRDDQDSASQAEHFGSVFGLDPNSPLRLTGSGPQSWWWGNSRTGLSDWWGSARPVMRMAIDHGFYQHPKAAILDADITAGATSLTLRSLERAALWPSSGELVIGTERMSYTSMADAGGGDYTFGGLTRGIAGTTAAAHTNGDGATGYRDYCLIPDGATWQLDGAINNSVTTFAIKSLLTGPNGAGPAVGDLILLNDEQMLVTGVGPLVVTRGANGTTAAAHNDEDRGCNVDTSGEVTVVTTSPVRATGWMGTVREDGDLVRMLLPESLQSAQPASTDPFGDWVEIPLGVTDHIYRGTHYNSGGAYGYRGEQMTIVDGVAATRAFRGQMRFPHSFA